MIQNPIEFREKILNKYPRLKEGECPIPNARFWDFYNAGGKEQLYEAGIVVIKKNDTWQLRLHPEIPSVVKNREINEFLEEFDWYCPSCGGPVVLEENISKRGVSQYRLRCLGWFEDERKVRGYGKYRQEYMGRVCYHWSGSITLSHLIANALKDAGVELRDAKDWEALQDSLKDSD